MSMISIVQLMLYIQAATVVVCLLFGAIIDLLKREISDIPWIIMMVEGIITSIVMLIFTKDPKSTWMIFGINFATAFILGILLYYTGVMGGADAKAIMALSVNTAMYPFSLPLTSLYIYSFIPTSFNIFFNWLLTMIIFYPIPLLFYNIIRHFRGIPLFQETNASLTDKILALISGYVIPVEKGKNRIDILYSEVYDEEKKIWKVKNFLQVQEIEEEEKFKNKVEDWIEKTGKKYVWVKVLPPGILFLLIGYIATLFIGNPLFALLSFLSS